MTRDYMLNNPYYLEYVEKFRLLTNKELQYWIQSAMMGDSCDDHDGTPEGRDALRQRLMMYEAQAVAADRELNSRERPL